MALSQSTARNIKEATNISFRSHAVKASATIYQGAALGFSAGAARPLTAGDPFAGFALEDRSGGSTDGATSVRAVLSGILSGISVTGATGLANIVAPNNDVFASDDGTFTLTIGSNSKIGHIVAYNSAEGTFDVFFEAFCFRSNT